MKKLKNCISKYVSSKRHAALMSVFVLAVCLMFSVSTAAADTTLAFPGAEGGGKYTKGARASSTITVYHVTNLNSSGTGSLADAVSRSGRIVVFDVGGTIDMGGNTLTISGNNLTILGQTAPGDGITITNGDLLLQSSVEQVIIRYLRVRPTDEKTDEPDGIGGRWNNHIIIDHCSTSWGVDELLTLYAGSSESESYEVGSNLTVQNTLSSESLRMSNHIKGAHGYGAIFGATNSTWYRNLLAHHDSRSPRLDRELQKTDIRNNVIYNWGQTNSAYGGEGYSYNNVTQYGTYVNYADNYYKYGPATKSSLRSRIFQISDSYGSTQQFYFGGNYVWGYDSVTSDNSQGIDNASGNATLLSSAIDMGDYEIENLQTAEEAYDTVLDDVGATLPKRDAIDARVIADVKNQTGRIINNADEVGGVIETEKTTQVFEIPSDWLSENGYTGMSETSIISDGSEWDGYTVIEAYVNDWTAQQSAPTNPEITVKSPAIQDMNSLGTNNKWAVITEGETLSYQATAAASTSDTTITKFEIYDGDTLIDTVDNLSGSSVDINETLTLKSGTHYITSRAYNNKSEATQSPTSIVYVKGDSSSSEYTHTQIGSTAFGESGGSWTSGDTVTIMGSGKLLTPGSDGYSISGVSSDSCDFAYKELTGDFDFTVLVDQIPKYENFVVAGLMVREDLSPTGRMAFLADGWLKYGENCEIISRTTAGSASSVTYFKNSSGSEVKNGSNYDTSSSAYSMPNYMRIQRSGNTLTFSVSDDGVYWTGNARQPRSITFSGLADTLYVGFAVDSAQGTPRKEYMSEAKFMVSNIGEVIPTATPDPTATPTATPIPESAISIADDENGAVMVTTSTGTYCSSDVETIWSADDNCGDTKVGYSIYTAGEVHNINGVDDEYGTFTLFTTAYLMQATNTSGDDVKYITGSSNPSITVPVTEENEPTGSVFKIVPAKFGILSLDLRLTSSRYFNIYDNTSGEYIVENERKNSTAFYTYEFECQEGHEYYVWITSGRAGLASITWTPKSPTSLAGDTVYVTGKPIDGYFLSDIKISGVEVTKVSDNVFSFVMPDSDVEITPVFLAVGSPTATPDPTATPTATPDPTATPTAIPTATPTAEPTATPTATPTSEPTTWSIKDYSGGVITVTAPSDTEYTEVYVIVAEYDGGDVLSGIEILPLTIEDGKTEYTLSTTADLINPKIMLWDSTLKPLTQAYR